jgi:hypothetical protein
MEWTGKDFLGQTYARVPYEAVAPMNDAARQARGIQYATLGVFNDPTTGALDPRKLAAFLDVPGQTNFIEVTDPDVARARRENYLMAAGEVQIPEPWDNHRTHITEHTAFLKTSEFESLSAEVQTTLLKHIQAHMTMAAEEAAQQQIKQENAPALAAAPNATQPDTLNLPGAPPSGPPPQPGLPPTGGPPPPAVTPGPAGAPNSPNPADAYFASRDVGVPLNPQVPPTS